MASAVVTQHQILPADGYMQSESGAWCPPDSPAYTGTKFDPKKHMCYSSPSKTITLAELNLYPTRATSPTAITAPFPLLTEAGVREVRADIFRREVVEKYGSLKFPGVYRVRGYGPAAPFVYDMWRSEAIRQACSAAAGVELEIVFDYEIGQLNVQLDSSIDKKAPITENLPPATPPREPLSKDTEDFEDDQKDLVAKWHSDSYPWVCVMMLSDPIGMKGGETALRTGDGSILKMKQPGMGYAVMMQGGSINHAALRCLSKGERITIVTSFRPRDPILRDTSTLRTVKGISNLDELFKQWTTYRTEVISKRAAILSKELKVAGRPADEIKKILQEWVKEQIEYLQATIEEMA